MPLATSSQHPLQFLDLLQDLLLDRAQFGQGLQGRAAPAYEPTREWIKTGRNHGKIFHKPRKELPIYFLGFLITWQFHKQI